jgi:hypothetical protein
VEEVVHAGTINSARKAAILLVKRMRGGSPCRVPAKIGVIHRRFTSHCRVHFVSRL